MVNTWSRNTSRTDTPVLARAITLVVEVPSHSTYASTQGGTLQLHVPVNSQSLGYEYSTIVTTKPPYGIPLYPEVGGSGHSNRSEAQGRTPQYIHGLNPIPKDKKFSGHYTERDSESSDDDVTPRRRRAGNEPMADTEQRSRRTQGTNSQDVQERIKAHEADIPRLKRDPETQLTSRPPLAPRRRGPPPIIDQDGPIPRRAVAPRADPSDLIPLGDLDDPNPPFTDEIMNAHISRKFKMPTIKAYDGTSDPANHVRTFSNALLLQPENDAINCRAFPQTLSGMAQRSIEVLWRPLSRGVVAVPAPLRHAIATIQGGDNHASSPQSKTPPWYTPIRPPLLCSGKSKKVAGAFRVESIGLDDWEKRYSIGTKQRRRGNGERKGTRAVLLGAKAAGSGVEYSIKEPRVDYDPTKREVKRASHTRKYDWLPSREDLLIRCPPRLIVVGLPRPPFVALWDSRPVPRTPIINSRDELMKFLDKCCAKYKLEYDFFYLPIDFRTQQNKGYTFINFTKSPYAKIFHQVMTGYKWGFHKLGNKYFTSIKTCEITWAKLQGRMSLLGISKEASSHAIVNTICLWNLFLHAMMLVGTKQTPRHPFTSWGVVGLEDFRMSYGLSRKIDIHLRSLTMQVGNIDNMAPEVLLASDN
ncbi:hypothetical protein AgCh_028178 [Apium graveolens]